MGLARKFSRVLHDQVDVHAAWLPVTNTFKVGDYGLVSDGVLQKVGNIENDFGIQVEVAPGQPSSIDFTSERTRVIRLVGGAEVNTLPDQPIEAKLRIEFERAHSFLCKAATINVMEIQNLANVAVKLKSQDGWRKKYRVISATYSAEKCVIMSATEAGTVVELSGKADALQTIDLGSAEAGFDLSSTKSLGLEVVGETGVIGLRMFKLGTFGGFKLLSDDQGQNVEIEECREVDLEDDI